MSRSTSTPCCSRPDIPTRTPSTSPTGRPRYQQITEILDAAGIVVDDSLDLASVPADVQAKLAPHLAELNRPPTPPFRPPSGLQDQIMAAQAASLLTVSADGRIRVFRAPVDRNRAGRPGGRTGA